MIDLVRIGDKMRGIHRIYVSYDLIAEGILIKPYLNKKFWEFIESEEIELLFDVKIIDVIEEVSTELLGLNYKFEFDLIPNQEKIEEVKNLEERLQIGL